MRIFAKYGQPVLATNKLPPTKVVLPVHCAFCKGSGHISFMVMAPGAVLFTAMGCGTCMGRGWLPKLFEDVHVVVVL